MLYQLTEHNGYWASVIKSDIAKGATPQRAVCDVHMAVLLMGRGPQEAMRVAEESAYWAGVDLSSIRW